MAPEPKKQLHIQVIPVPVFEALSFLLMAGVKEVQTPKARLLGAELRDLRTNAGLTVRDLGKLLDVAQATVSRYERGERSPKLEYVAHVLGVLGVSGAKYDEIVEFAITASEPNMIADGSKGMHRHLIEISEFERAATRVVHVAPLLVPGLLQTRAYAREVMSAHRSDERDVRVELRMARQDVLGSSRRIEAVVSETVLRDSLGGPRVMAEQLRYIVSVAQHPNVLIRVLPANLNRWTLAHDGAFALYEFSKASPIVHLEHYRGPAFLFGTQDVGAYLEAVGKAREMAMSPESSVELIAALSVEMEGYAYVETHGLAQVN